MIFDDIFYPGNPKRREEVALLHGTIKSQFIQFRSAWNSMASELSSALEQANHPHFRFCLKPLTFDIASDTIDRAVREINSVLDDARGKLAKVVEDTGIDKSLPADWGDKGFEFGPNTSVLTAIKVGLTGVSAVAASFITWYIYQGVQLMVALVNMGGAMISQLASVAGGAIGGIIIGAAAFIITDLIVSAITGAVERSKLRDAIHVLTEIKEKVGDSLAAATPKVAGVTQSIKDGLYKLDDTHILYRVKDEFIIIDTPKSQPLKLVGSGQPEGKVIFAFA